MKGRGERTYSMKEEDVSPLLVEVAGEGPAGLAALEEGDGRHGGQGQGGPAGFLDSMYGMAASYFSKNFMSGCGILFPLIITVYATWWLLQFFDDFFSPIYQSLFGFHVFGLGFITSMAFIFLTGLLGSSWLGQLLLWGGEVIVAKVPFVSSIYSATKQIGNAMNPSKDSSAFQEFVIIKHPRMGEFAFGFITGKLKLQGDFPPGNSHAQPDGSLLMYTVYVPTNHVYVGDTFMLGDKDILRTNLTVSEGLEVVISCGMASPDMMKVHGSNLKF